MLDLSKIESVDRLWHKCCSDEQLLSGTSHEQQQHDTHTHTKKKL
jgi:hypothetical protein